jgi:hypothetical protein
MSDFVWFIISFVAGFIVGALVFKNNEKIVAADTAKVSSVVAEVKTVVADVEKDAKKL